ncbi:MAG: hypothetical protein M3Z75_05155 [Actinomycetota bacterium]|nr:hypothetical protein [Actinomycetota bacterium]
MLSLVTAGTVKLPDPELPCVAEAVTCTGGGGEAIAECVAAGVLAPGLVAGAVDGAGAVAEPEAVDTADTEPPEADPVAVGDFDPDPPQAVRPAPLTMMAMIATGTRRILMLLPSRE